jgi:hypothetical protein
MGSYQMKEKVSYIVAMLLCIGAVASAQTVTLGTFGYCTVNKPATNLNLVGYSFGDGTSTLNEVLPVDQFNGSVFFSQADRVIVWNSGTQSYTTYALFDDTAYAGTTIEWRNGNDFTGIEENPIIPSGSGFWVQSIGSSEDSSIYISGDVISSQFATNQIVVGLQMVAYPFSMVVDLNETQLKDNAKGAVFFTDADRVIAWNETTQAYATYALFDDTAYGGSTVEWRNGNSFTSPAGAIPLGLGNGFWIDAKNSFSWVETNKYYNSL